MECKKLQYRHQAQGRIWTEQWRSFKDLEFFFQISSIFHYRVACYAILHPHLSVRPSVCRSVRHFTFFILILWPHCSCPNGQVTSNMVFAHPHATGVPVYPALFQNPFVAVRFYDNSDNDNSDFDLI